MIIVSNVPKTKIYSVSSVTINVTLPLTQASNLNQRQLWFLGRVQQGLTSKADDIEAAWGVTLRTAKRDIAGLIDLQLIRFSGARKNGRYRPNAQD
jgi:Fic family protein